MDEYLKGILQKLPATQETKMDQNEPAAPKQKAEVQIVDMQDGRKVEFAGKRKLLKETIIEGDSVSVRLDFRNGETRLFTVPQELLLKAAGHGIEQKLGDETAGTEDVDDMVLDVDNLIDRLKNFEWSTKRESSGFAGTSVLLRAIVEWNAGKKTVEQVKEWLKPKSAAEKMALRNSPKLKPIVERLESEKQAKNNKVDTDALLGELDAG